MLSLSHSKRSEPSLEEIPIFFKPTSITYQTLFISFRKGNSNSETYLSRLTSQRLSRTERGGIEDQRWETFETFDQGIL